MLIRSPDVSEPCHVKVTYTEQPFPLFLFQLDTSPPKVFSVNLQVSILLKAEKNRLSSLALSVTTMCKIVPFTRNDKQLYGSYQTKRKC